MKRQGQHTAISLGSGTLRREWTHDKNADPGPREIIEGLPRPANDRLVHVEKGVLSASTRSSAAFEAATALAGKVADEVGDTG
jgi:hypothetical protein